MIILKGVNCAGKDASYGNGYGSQPTAAGLWRVWSGASPWLASERRTRGRRDEEEPRSRLRGVGDLWVGYEVSMLGVVRRQCDCATQ